MNAAVDKIKEIYSASYEERPLITLFIATTGIFLLIYLVLLILTWGNLVNLTFYNDRTDVFMDFFNSAYDATHGPYTDKNVMYPPFTVMIYSLLGQCIQSSTGDVSAFGMRDSSAGMTVFIIFTLISVIALILLSYTFIKNEKMKYRIPIVISIALSLPLLFSIDRGNCIVYAVACSLLFVIFYDSDDWKKRLIAYIALGIATGLKIYPALFWILLIRDNRIKDAAICASIVLIMFFIPFMFFENSLSMFGNIMTHTSSTTVGAYTIKDVFSILSFVMPTAVSSAIGWGVTFILLAITIYVVLKKEDLQKWIIVTLICCNLSVGFGMGTGYLCLYIAIAALYFLSDESDPTKRNRIYSVMFAFFLVLLALPVNIFDSAAITTSVKSISIMIFTVMFVYNILKNKVSGPNGSAN